MDKDAYAIYRVKEGSETEALRYKDYSTIKAKGFGIDHNNYRHIYTGVLEQSSLPADEKLEAIFERFNRVCPPKDFPGRSMHISDIIVLRSGGETAAYYADTMRFYEAPEFLKGPYKYYSTQRPVDIGTFPKSGAEPVNIKNYDSRMVVEGGAFRAWGELSYSIPLTQKQMDDYELRAALGNPNQMKLAPEQLEARVQIIGKWEKARRVSDTRRMTWWHPDFGVYVKKEFITDEQAARCFDSIMEIKAREAEKRAAKKPITEQLAEAAKQAERGVQAPAKKQNKSHEDR